MLLVVWWAWNYTTWVTNELDPDSPVVRLLLIGDHARDPADGGGHPGCVRVEGLLFACSYVAIQVGRHAFLTFVVGASRGRSSASAPRDILIWFVAAGVLLDRGRARRGRGAHGCSGWSRSRSTTSRRSFLYRVPGRPKLAPETWDVETAHFAERFQLFVIIALGESIVLIGATTSDLDIDAARLAALALAFAGTAALWWLYFDYVAPIAQRRLELAPNRTLLARDGYTYLHVVLIAGIIVWAVGDELVIAHPTDVLPAAEVAVLVAGPGDLPARARALPPADGRDAVAGSGWSARLRASRSAGSARSRPASCSPACSSPCSSA